MDVIIKMPHSTNVTHQIIFPLLGMYFSQIIFTFNGIIIQDKL